MVPVAPTYETPPWMPGGDSSAESFRPTPPAGGVEGGGVYRPQTGPTVDSTKVPTKVLPSTMFPVPDGASRVTLNPIPQPQTPPAKDGVVELPGTTPPKSANSTLYPNGAPYSWSDLIQKHVPAAAPPARSTTPTSIGAVPDNKPLTAEELASKLLRAGVGKADVERAVAQYASTEGAITSEILNKLLAENGVYVQRAREAGERYAAEKGLLTSSMAAGAAHGAAVDRAGEIAKADAQAGLQVNLHNSSVGTNVNLANAEAANRASLQANELSAQAEMQRVNAANSGVLDSIAFKRNADWQDYQAKQSRAWGVEDQNFATEQDAFWKNKSREWGLNDNNTNFLRNQAQSDTDYLRNLENRDYNTATTNRAQALQYMTGFDSSMMESLKGIWSDPNLTAEQKQTLANKFISDGTALRNSTLNAIFSGVPGFSASFEKFPGAAPGTNVPATGIDPKTLNPIAVTPPVRVEPKYLPVGR